MQKSIGLEQVLEWMIAPKEAARGNMALELVAKDAGRYYYRDNAHNAMYEVLNGADNIVVRKRPYVTGDNAEREGIMHTLGKKRAGQYMQRILALRKSTIGFAAVLMP